VNTQPTKRILTYGTFDVLHFGHMRLLTRARKLGGQLFVGLSSDSFNTLKGKQAEWSYERRRSALLATQLVDSVFAETHWEQKPDDIARLNINIFVMGDDWQGKFDYLSAHCDVVYLSRTPGISSTLLRHALRTVSV
jgi:glycerol-3-phosphate cytidylyltransferase